ncbi:MAG: hypothetical protein HY235_30785 [Acidobacteria bacterium]|nr:hypothetical protein [Acidobacteriota bacterium]
MKQLSLLIALLGLFSCKKAPPPDPICRTEPLPSTAAVKSGQAAIQILAPAQEYFYVFDEKGKQIGSEHTGRSYTAKPGAYVIKLNHSSHPVSAASNMLTKCEAGAVLVSGQTDQYYYLFDGSGAQLASAHLGKATVLFPGKYEARLNHTAAPVEVKPGGTTEVKSGTLSVPGQTEEYYYVFDAAGAQLASARLSSPLSLLAGSWNVQLNQTKARADITAGGITEIRPGALLVKAPTEEYYYVLDAAGTQLASARLNKAVSLMEGSYTLKLNSVSAPVQVQAGATTEYQAGTLAVKGSGEDYYYVMDSLGGQLASAKIGRMLALPAGKYQVKRGQETRQASVTEGRETVLNW